jgi:N-acetylglucosamine kinase-like BadF-type ATPase
VRAATARALAGLGKTKGLDLYIVGRGRMPDGVADERAFRSVTGLSVREQDGPLALAHATAGIVVLAGTGAFVYGRSPAGAEVFLDALGPLLGDAGSAFDIGLRAIRAAARAGWGPRHATAMAAPLIEACAAYAGGKGGFDLVSYMLQHRDRSELASLARIVDEHAEAGDVVARRVLEEAADAIAETLRDVVARLSIGSRPLPMVAAGSVARRSRIYWRRVCERAAEIGPGLLPCVPEQREVYGAILAASPRIPGLDPAFGPNLRASALKLGSGGRGSRRAGACATHSCRP